MYHRKDGWQNSKFFNCRQLGDVDMGNSHFGKIPVWQGRVRCAYNQTWCANQAFRAHTNPSMGLTNWRETGAGKYSNLLVIFTFIILKII